MTGFGVSGGRIKGGDEFAHLGLGFPDIISLAVAGNLVAYTAYQDLIFAPLSLAPERHGFVMTLADVHTFSVQPGAGGAGLDTYILRLIDQTPDTLGAGTVSSAGTAVTGVGTAFTSFYVAGVSLIRAGGQTFLVTAIADDTHLTLEAAPAANWAGAAHYRVNYLSEIGRIYVPANQQFVAPVDLRNASKIGVGLKAGQGIRLDTGAISAGYTTLPANIRLKCSVETYSIDA